MIPVLWALLARYLPHRNRRFVALGVVSVVAGVLEAALLVLTVRAVVAIGDGADRVEVDVPLVGRPSVDVSVLLWWAVGAGVLAGAAGLAVAGMAARTSADVLAGTRAATLRAFSRASWDHQASSREGAVQEAVSNNAMQASDVTIFLSRGLSALITLVAILGAASLVNLSATLAVVGLGLLIVLLLRPITKATRGRATRFVGSNARFAEAVAETSALALEMRVFGVEEAQAERLVDEARQTGRHAFLTRFSSNAGATIYRSATLLFLVGAVGGLHAVGDVDLSAVGAVVVLMVRALSYAQQTQSYAQRINEVTPNLVALDARIRELEAAEERFGGAGLDRIRLVSLRDVSYSYGPQPALRHLNLDIEAGERLGIVGPSGGGKSTLVQVLLRLRLPTTGAVLIDGRPYEEVAPADWAHLVSLVPQDPRLFAGTVADNIAFHREAITRDQIVAAAVRANIAEEIEQLPGGFDAELGARGSGLSGGQRQRLAIARSLVGEPDLLVLDEPTSALDVHSERLLEKTFSELEGRVTMVIVAHRLSTIAACERLLVLEDGAISALGPYAEVQRHPFLRRASIEAPRQDSGPRPLPRGLARP
ncbi:MAG: ABC transporter ATP-binding protein [Acidimicrobiales bacterium]